MRLLKMNLQTKLTYKSEITTRKGGEASAVKK